MNREKQTGVGLGTWEGAEAGARVGPGEEVVGRGLEQGLELGQKQELPCSGVGQGVLEGAGVDRNRVRPELRQGRGWAGGRSSRGRVGLGQLGHSDSF